MFPFVSRAAQTDVALIKSLRYVRLVFAHVYIIGFAAMSITRSFVVTMHTHGILLMCVCIFLFGRRLMLSFVLVWNWACEHRCLSVCAGVMCMLMLSMCTLLRDRIDRFPY